VALVAAGVAAPIIVWAVMILTGGHTRFAVLAPQARSGVEAASALARLFGALVLFLGPGDRAGQRLRWVAGGLVVMGLGGFVFGYLQPLVSVAPTLNVSLYESLIVRGVAAILLVVGLVPAKPPPFSWWSMLIALAGCGALCGIAVAGAALLPPLAHINSLEAAAAHGEAPLRWVTAWQWALSGLVLGLLIVALLGAIRSCCAGAMGVWLVVALVLLAGSQLHATFWPSAFSQVLTTADLLRLVFVAVVALGGILELRRIATERAGLLARERERSRRLVELAVLKADFTSMVTHELGTPLAAIHGFLDMLDTGELSRAEEAHARAAIRAETAMVSALVADVQAAATVERDDFAVHPRPVPVSALLADAMAFARTLPGAHPVTATSTTHQWVRADPERIGQVLRNLLGNAAKYSPAGTPIELRAMPHEGRLRIAVADQGPGIHPDDVPRIFEKFGRGRDRWGRTVAGVGLGLYLSRRIVQAHGAELDVDSTPGLGAVFAFDLEVAR
jgi:signal transduction histidine kinase